MSEREQLRDAGVVVVKIGTSVLTGGTDRLDRAYLHDIAAQIASICDEGRRVVLVSSGAVGAGVGVLRLEERPTVLGEVQAAAAAGQPELIRQWSNAFGVRGRNVAQVLVSRTDFDARDRFLNIRTCLTALLEKGVVPIVNENDAVATDEIALEDNDVLASKVAHASEADALIILTSAPGVMRADDSVIDVATDADQLRAHVRTDATSQGTGGMATKVDAADAATRAGIATVIGPGRPAQRLGDTVRGMPFGTLVLPRSDRPRARDAWLGLSATPSGAVVIDLGAVNALRDRGASLLPKGVVAVRGEFSAGEVVAVESFDGRPVANGIANLGSFEIDRIKGLRSDELSAELGYDVSREVIHRDNLVMLST